MPDSIAPSLVVAEGALLHRMLLQVPFVSLDEQAQRRPPSRGAKQAQR